MSAISTTSLKPLTRLISDAHTILILQPEKPDTDSLCSALALEQLLGEQGKEVVLYSKDPLPAYIDYFEGADRLVDELPKHFDFTILVDAGGPSQIGRTLEKYSGRLSAKPFVIIDHHASREPFPSGFTLTELIDDTAAATGQIVAAIAAALKWPISSTTASLIVPAIMADTLGLTNALTTADAIEVVAQMVRCGADMHTINQARLEAGALTPELLALRARMLSSIEFLLDGQLALLVIDPDTLKTYAKAYDPAALVFFDMQHVKGVKVAAAIKNYGTKVKLSLRANLPVAARVAETFGGGGHAHAAAAAIEAGDIGAIRTNVITTISKELAGDSVDIGK